jgi:polysaccharide pyruvyl transferase WcaK-like protein
MHSIGIESLVVDPRRMDQEQILNVIEEAYERRADLRQQLERKMPQVKEAVLNLFDGTDGLLACARA